MLSLLRRKPTPRGATQLPSRTDPDRVAEGNESNCCSLHCKCPHRLRKILNFDSSLLQRTLNPMAGTQRPTGAELARDRWEIGSSCCSSRCTCPRRLNAGLLISMRKSAINLKRAAASARKNRKQAAIANVKSRQRRTTRRSCQAHAQIYIPPK
jgi:hypothetical protein